ncbi:DUF3267 domain-containing protein [Sphingobacterium sp. DN00404]|uniref:DUF3267 domain-containing protein n=1 Tax=Sphingobacterium micropteri TaxID=2763501 RepID=A0ABR7YSW5_9SPHI|nr:DUF3267 domain-containing protein [Sphingobacterium micropteri]MBD1434418.1 DUF3267 domain-containing protein [Sphingobacterium micropteri]
MNQVTLKNYTKEARLINLYKANAFSLLFFIPVILIYGVPFYLIWGRQDYIEIMRGYFDGNSVHLAIAILLVTVLGIVLHELIHGITWAIFAKRGFKSIKFGIILKMITPYCHCKEPLTTKQYITGAITPSIILGFIPALASLVMGSFPLLIFAIFFTVGAAGDFMIIRLMLKEDQNSLVLDHPSEAGYYVFVKN